jgi:hypothetical protein
MCKTLTFWVCCTDLTQESGLFFYDSNMLLDAFYTPFFNKKKGTDINTTH